MRIINLAYLFVILSFAVSAYYYPLMPDQMVSHWGLAGEPNGYLSKAFLLFLMPALSLVMLVVFYFIPRIDPLKKNISKFKNYYEGFIVLLIGFLLYIQLITIFWNSGMRFQIIQAIIPAFAVLFYYIGVMMEHTKRNWFIGIRTPWTISSDVVWDKTHKIGGKIFRAVGIISLLGTILNEYAFYLMIVPIIVGMVYTVAYTYFEYKKLKK